MTGRSDSAEAERADVGTRSDGGEAERLAVGTRSDGGEAERPAVGTRDDGGEAERARTRPERGEAERLARATLAPLAPDERPPALLVATVVCLVLAAAVLVGALTIHDLSKRGGSVPGAIVLGGVLVMLARGMHTHRYWAVLGFEALLAFQIVVTSLALIVASTITAAALCLAAIGLGGWLFWKLVRVMGRIQAGER